MDEEPNPNELLVTMLPDQGGLKTGRILAGSAMVAGPIGVVGFALAHLPENFQLWLEEASLCVGMVFVGVLLRLLSRNWANSRLDFYPTRIVLRKPGEATQEMLMGQISVLQASEGYFVFLNSGQRLNLSGWSDQGVIWICLRRLEQNKPISTEDVQRCIDHPNG